MIRRLLTATGIVAVVTFLPAAPAFADDPVQVCVGHEALPPPGEVCVDDGGQLGEIELPPADRVLRMIKIGGGVVSGGGGSVNLP